jgi:tRNA (cytidine32/uridine32-2'-O)-methyltransferase
MVFPVRIVLVATSHPGNIGAAARAMKNMGLSELVLVRPESYPHADATTRASAADDVLRSACVHARLEDAISDCGLVVGTSARQRHLPWTLIEPRECARTVISAASRSAVAIVFGAERAGLTNDELALCNLLVTIPTAPGYSSLNVAMAVQILAYELWMAGRETGDGEPARDVPLASSAEMARLFEHLEAVLEYIDFRDRTGGGHLMTRLRRLFNRAVLDQNELNIRRGI